MGCLRRLDSVIQNPNRKTPNYIISKTPNAAQRIVFTLQDKPNEYPSTPLLFEGNPLTAYKDNLIVGAPFFRNHNGEYVIVKSGFSKDKQTLYLLTKAGYVYQKNNDDDLIPVPIAELTERISDKDLSHSLAEITFEDGLFVHGKVETGFHPTEELEELFEKYIQGLL